MLLIFFASFFSLIFLFSIAWILSIKLRRIDTADMAWALGFPLALWTAYFLSSSSSSYGFAVNALISIWSLRLLTHLFLRNKLRSDDFRYQDLKKNWIQYQSLQIFIKVFIFQAFILFFVSLPVLWIHTHIFQGDWIFFKIALPIWIFGFIIESVADFQLLRYQKDRSQKEAILTKGVWSYVRHPNYLGEIIQWWSIWICCLAIPLGWIFFLSPMLLNLLIVYVSGVAPLEKRMRERPEFIKYSASTPSLIPSSLINGYLYYFAWNFFVYWGRFSILTSTIVFLVTLISQFFLFIFKDKESLACCFPIAVNACIFGIFQEILLINFSAISYPDSSIFPPFWIVFLYILFATTLNSSLSFLNRNLILTFFLGGVGGVFSYLVGEQVGAVHVNQPIFIFFSWGIYLALLLSINRRIVKSYRSLTDPKTTEPVLKVLFDDECPICSREIHYLKKREHVGGLIFIPLSDPKIFTSLEGKFTKAEALKVIHGVTVDGTVWRGIDLFALLYAKSGFVPLAVALKSPLLNTIFQVLYWLWTKIR